VSTPETPQFNSETFDAYDDFMSEMDALGLTESLVDQLPPGFSAVYEIGRILAHPHSSLSRAGRSALQLIATGEDVAQAGATASDAVLIEVPAGEEYEAEFEAWCSEEAPVFAAIAEGELALDADEVDGDLAEIVTPIGSAPIAGSAG
jgi:hypothetical protein